MMHSRGFQIINYVDDYIGFGRPSSVQSSFKCLYDLLHSLGLTISATKLVPLSTCSEC